MLFNYKEIITKYGTDYRLQKAIEKKEVYKIEKGIYSNEPDNFTLYELLLKKYPNSVLVKDSALNFIGFLDNGSEKVHLGTARNALRIHDKRVKQHFYKNIKQSQGVNKDLKEDSVAKDQRTSWDSYDPNVGCFSANIHKYTTPNGNEIRLFDLRNLLLDLLRDRNKYERKILIALLSKFRDCNIVIGINFFPLEEIYYDIMFDAELSNLLEEIKKCDFDRAFEREINDLF